VRDEFRPVERLRGVKCFPGGVGLSNALLAGILKFEYVHFVRDVVFIMYFVRQQEITLANRYKYTYYR